MITTDWFPSSIYEWIKHQATILGVPESYISIPLLVSVAYCSQHTTVNVADMHVEPLILYALVCGRSGTNKSRSLQIILDLLNELDCDTDGSHTFDSGTLEGLMQSMRQNKGCIMACHDEFSTFNDGLDKGSSGSSEKSRYLSLYSGSSWSKKTKTSGNVEVKDPRLNMFAFTQPYYAAQFARGNLSDGFYQRFLISVPQEVFIKRQDKMKIRDQQIALINMRDVLQYIYNMCSEKDIQLKFSEEGELLYEKHHDSIVEFRQEDVFEEAKLSIKSKSLGLLMRISGVISLLRLATENLPCSGMKQACDPCEILVHKNDAEMALKIVDYSVNNAFALLPKIQEVSRKSSTIKMKSPLPEPENLTMEYLRQYERVTKRLLSEKSIPLATVSKNKIYPIVNNVMGSHIANKFVNGIVKLGFGQVSPSSKSFKRYHPNYESCPNSCDKEELRKKYRLLNL